MEMVYIQTWLAVCQMIKCLIRKSIHVYQCLYFHYWVVPPHYPSQETFGSGPVLGHFSDRTGPVLSQNQTSAGIKHPHSYMICLLPSIFEGGTIFQCNRHHHNLVLSGWHQLLVIMAYLNILFLSELVALLAVQASTKMNNILNINFSIWRLCPPLLTCMLPSLPT